MKTFRVTYTSFEGNRRWTEYEMDEDATVDDVRNRIFDECHTFGDDICDILSIDET